MKRPVYWRISIEGQEFGVNGNGYHARTSGPTSEAALEALMDFDEYLGWVDPELFCTLDQIGDSPPPVLESWMAEAYLTRLAEVERLDLINTCNQLTGCYIEFVHPTRTPPARCNLSSFFKQVVVRAMQVFGGPKFGYVYLLRSVTGYWKIGRAKDPDDRLKVFTVKLPFEVEYEHLIPSPDYIAAESYLHEVFDALRVNGEWFALTDKDVNYIKSMEAL